MKKRDWLPWSLLIVLLLALDQATKLFFSNNRADFQEREIIPDFFYLTYLENRGAAFSLMQNFRWGFVAITLVALAVMIRFFLMYKTPVAKLSLSFLIAGAAGNLVDRAWQGYVVDFLHFFPFGYDFPVFNVADICINVGAALMVIWLLFMYKEPEHANTKKT